MFLMGSEQEEALKKAFKRVKGHIEALEGEIRANRQFIISQNQQIEAQNRQILAFLEEMKSQKWVNKAQNGQNQGKMGGKEPLLSLEKSVSRSNKGAQSINHSTVNQSLNNQSLNIMQFREDLPLILDRVSRQEFLTFLMVYQLEEQIGKVSYDAVANGLSLTSSCVRSYVSNLIKKGLPVVKKRYNNRITILSIPPEIRGLNMKKQLIQMFYNLDPNQKKLFDGY